VRNLVYLGGAEEELSLQKCLNKVEDLEDILQVQAHRKAIGQEHYEGVRLGIAFNEDLFMLKYDREEVKKLQRLIHDQNLSAPTGMLKAFISRAGLEVVEKIKEANVDLEMLFSSY